MATLVWASAASAPFSSSKAVMTRLGVTGKLATVRSNDPVSALSEERVADVPGMSVAVPDVEGLG